MRTRAIVSLALAAALACGPAGDSHADTARAATALPAAAADSHPFAVSDSGAGPLRIGMSFAHAVSARAVSGTAAPSACAACAKDIPMRSGPAPESFTAKG